MKGGHQTSKIYTYTGNTILFGVLRRKILRAFEEIRMNNEDENITEAYA